MAAPLLMAALCGAARGPSARPVRHGPGSRGSARVGSGSRSGLEGGTGELADAWVPQAGLGWHRPGPYSRSPPAAGSLGLVSRSLYETGTLFASSSALEDNLRCLCSF